MFKLVVLSLLAAAVAEPSGLFYSSPLTYSTVVAPATTTITKSASSVVHPSPIYTAFAATPFGYSHFIKKRSAQYIPYYASSSLISAPLTTRLISTPFVHSPAILPYAASLPLATTHFIKKRSAQFIPYYASSNFISTPLTSRLISTPFVHSPAVLPYIPATTLPLATTHFIKKRSVPELPTGPVIISDRYAAYPSVPTPAPIDNSNENDHITHVVEKRSAQFLTTYSVPTSYSHQSRVDLINHPSPVLKVASYHVPLNYPVLF